MDQQTNIEPEQEPESLAEVQTSPREELVQAIVLNIRQLFEAASSDEVLARFRQVHPVDQGEALTSLSEDIRRLLLENLIPRIEGARDIDANRHDTRRNPFERIGPGRFFCGLRDSRQANSCQYCEYRSVFHCNPMIWSRLVPTLT